MNERGHRILTFMGDFAKPLTALLVVISLILLTSNIISSQLFFSTRIVNQGKVRVIDVSVYWDSNCTNVVSTINWGVLTPGSAKNVTMFIRNEGNEVINLFLSTENWNPQNASRSMTLEWNYSGKTLKPHETVQLTLSLLVASNITGIKSFSFNIIIGAASSE